MLYIFIVIIKPNIKFYIGMAQAYTLQYATE